MTLAAIARIIPQGQGKSEDGLLLSTLTLSAVATSNIRERIRSLHCHVAKFFAPPGSDADGDASQNRFCHLICLLEVVD